MARCGVAKNRVFRGGDEAVEAWILPAYDKEESWERIKRKPRERRAIVEVGWSLVSPLVGSVIFRDGIWWRMWVILELERMK